MKNKPKVKRLVVHDIFYRFGAGHSRYAGPVKAQTADEAFALAKEKWASIWEDNRITEFYAQRSPCGEIAGLRRHNASLSIPGGEPGYAPGDC